MEKSTDLQPEMQKEQICMVGRYAKCHFIYMNQMLAQKNYPKKCVFFGITNFATKQREWQILKMYSKSLKYPKMHQ